MSISSCEATVCELVLSTCSLHRSCRPCGPFRSPPPDSWLASVDWSDNCLWRHQPSSVGLSTTSVGRVLSFTIGGQHHCSVSHHHHRQMSGDMSRKGSVCVKPLAHVAWGLGYVLSIPIAHLESAVMRTVLCLTRKSEKQPGWWHKWCGERPGAPCLRQRVHAPLGVLSGLASES